MVEDDPKIVAVPSIAPLRLLRTKATQGMGCRWHWQVVYPDGAVNRIWWERKKDAIGQANFAVPYYRRADAVR